MKKFTASYWVFVLSIGLVCSYPLQVAEAQNHAGPLLSPSPLAAELTTPEQIAKYMWRHFSFEHDRTHFGKEEYWQTPEEMLTNRKGDCEDFALFAQAVLKRSGIKAFLLNIYGHRFSHTICVFLDNGKYSAIDGTDVKRYETDDLYELMNEIYPNWQTGAIVGRSPKSNKGRILKRFEKKLRTHQALASSL